MNSATRRVFGNVIVAVLILLGLLHLAQAQSFKDVTELGKPFRFETAAVAQWTYYKLNVDTLLAGMSGDDAINFFVTPYAGDVDLFVSANQFPTSRSCADCWKSTSPHGDIVSIARNDVRWPTSPAFFYIGVYSVSRSRFTFNTLLKSST